MGEEIVIGEGKDAVTITIVDAGYGRVRVGVIAPKTVPIRRGELKDTQQGDGDRVPSES